MDKKFGILLVVLALLAILLSNSFYTVDETEQVIITQFGAPVGSAVTEPGLKMKVPLSKP